MIKTQTLTNKQKNKPAGLREVCEIFRLLVLGFNNMPFLVWKGENSFVKIESYLPINETLQTDRQEERPQFDLQLEI